jgi:hypothetical protein
MDPVSQVWIDGVGIQTLAQLLPTPFKL